jgi:hypothetical protein
MRSLRWSLSARRQTQVRALDDKGAARRLGGRGALGYVVQAAAADKHMQLGLWLVMSAFVYVAKHGGVIELHP